MTPQETLRAILQSQPDRSREALLRVREDLAEAAHFYDEEDQEDPSLASCNLRHAIARILDDLAP